MEEQEIKTIKGKIQEKLTTGKVEVFNSNDIISICFFIPGKGDLTRRDIAMRAINSSKALNSITNRDFSIEYYDSEESRAVIHANEIIRKATRPAQLFCGDYHTDIELSLKNNHLQINISNQNIRKKGATSMFKECINAIKGELLEFNGISSISTSITGGSTMYSGVTISCSDDYDYDDGPTNPNWPSKTGNPSGHGRGNNPPGSRNR